MLIEHCENTQRFVTRIEGKEAYIEYSMPEDGVVNLLSTFVPEEGRGQGIAGKLAQAAFEYAQQKNYKVIPTCPFLPAWLEKNPQWKDLVK